MTHRYVGIFTSFFRYRFQYICNIVLLLTQDNFLLLLRKQDVKYKYIYWRRQGNLVFLQQLYTSVRVVLHHWVFLASTTPLMNGLVGPLQSFIHVSSDIESRSKKNNKSTILDTYCNDFT